jgi:hypothetical protein
MERKKGNWASQSPGTKTGKQSKQPRFSSLNFSGFCWTGSRCPRLVKEEVDRLVYCELGCSWFKKNTEHNNLSKRKVFFFYFMEKSTVAILRYRQKISVQSLKSKNEN